EKMMLPMKTRTRPVPLLALTIPLAGCATAPAPATGNPAQPYAGLEQRPIKALAAELNSYPGPRHVLDLAAELALTPDHDRAAEEACAAMEAEAKPFGQKLVEREAALDRAFAGGAATPDEVARLVGEAPAAEGQLRAVHLRAHLATKAVLTPEQVAR